MKKRMSAVLALAVIALAAMCMAMFPANKEQSEEYRGGSISFPVKTAEAMQALSEPRGIYTKIELTLSGGDGAVYATATNVLTIGFSEVQVILEMYASSTPQSDYLDMSLVGRNSITDLNMGDSLVLRVETRGVPRYWMARMTYQKDNGSWKEAVTKCRQANSLGEFID